jgi:signal transduction histidine kinase
LAIVGWNAGETGGAALCRQVRSTGIPNRPRLLLTVPAEVEDTDLEAVAEDVDELLGEPVRTAELRLRLRSLRRLGGLDDRVESQQRELHDAAGLRSDWIAMIVHDMRSPMTAILGYTDILLDHAEPRDKARLERVRGEALRINNMLERMLVMARSEAGRLKLAKVETDLHELVQGVRKESLQRASRCRAASRCPRCGSRRATARPRRESAGPG